MKKAILCLMILVGSSSLVSLGGCNVWVHDHDRDHVDHPDVVVHEEVRHDDDHHDDHHDDIHP